MELVRRCVRVRVSLKKNSFCCCHVITEVRIVVKENLFQFYSYLLSLSGCILSIFQVLFFHHITSLQFFYLILPIQNTLKTMCYPDMTQKEVDRMQEVIASACKFPNNYTSDSQRAMIDRFRFMLNLSEQLDKTLHSPSQIEMYTNTRSIISKEFSLVYNN